MITDVPGSSVTHPDPTSKKVRRRGRSAAASRLIDDRWPDRFATIFFVYAALVVILAVVPPWHRFFAHNNDALSMLTIPVAPGVGYAALLMVMGVALRRRLRVAWWLMMVWWLILPQLVRILAFVNGAPVIELVLQGIGFVLILGVIVIAIRTRDQFNVRRVPGSLGLAIAIFVVGGTATIVLGTLLINRFGESQNTVDSANHAFNGLLGDLGRVGPIDHVMVPWWVRLIVAVLGASVIIVSALVLFRPPKSMRTLNAADEARIRTLLRDFGDHDSLGYFATRRDKAIVWDTGDASTARAGVSHRAVGSISLASGNPVGDPVHWPAAIEAWRQEARSTGLSLAVMGAGEVGAAAYGEAGLSAYEIGDEAIVDFRSFSLSGPGMKAVRQPVSRLQRRGYTTQVLRHRELDSAAFDALSAEAAEWRGDGGDERGFSMALGRLGDPLDGDCVMVQVHDDSGRLRGFLSLAPWGRNGLSLDLMRRDPTADNGLIELMVASLAERAVEFGVARVSLNFAMFREAFERGEAIGAGPLSRLWRHTLVLASRNWQLESLYRSNAKYQPSWRPRFICFEYASDLPRVGTAAGSAEGFLTRPSLSSLVRHNDAAPEAPALERADEAYAAAVEAQIPEDEDLLAKAMSDQRLPEQVRVRRAKVERLRKRGVDPYPAAYPRTHTLAEVRAEVGELAPDVRTGRTVSVTGRVLLKRKHGGLGFGTLRDGTGDLQVLVTKDRVSKEVYDLWLHDVDLGDHVGVTGEVITSRTGELTVDAESLQITSKSLRPLPDKHRGLTDPEARVRARHVDLIIRPQARKIAYARSTVVRSVRDSLQRRGFTEAETPILQLIHGGANARPFETHINAYDLDLYLRIATELHLKRLVVGGMEQVFEIGRQFRNEGVDFKHNPEFTSLEVYQAYSDYNSMRVLTQEIIQEAAVAVYGVPVARRADADGKVVEYDLSGQWPVKTICEAVSEKLGEEITADTPAAELHKHANAIGLDLDPDAGWGHVLEEVYGELCEATTTTPVFYTDFPKENAPLTREHRVDPRLAEKWDLVIFAAEQGTAYTELVDPLEQRRRLVAQSLLAAAGDPEAMQVDEDFLSALEYAMPPTGGMGLGIDRLVMNLTGLSIRDTILFPLVKPSHSRG